MQYERRDDGRIVARGRHPDIQFAAKNVQRTRTGPHALVAIGAAKVPWARENINLDNDTGFTKLANSAAKHRGAGAVLSEEYSARDLKDDLSDFCYGIWDFHTGRFGFKKLGGLMTDEEPSFLWYPYILEEAGTLLYGLGGGGKSATMMAMAVALDEGIECPFGKPMRKAKVGIVNLERGERSMEIRLTRINMALGLPRNRGIYMLNARGKTLADVMHIVRKEIREFGLDCLMIDSVSRAGAGDLNENETANTIIDDLNSLGKSWLGIGHSPAGDDKKMFGSEHFKNGADVMVNLRSVKKPDHTLGITLTVRKANDIAWPPERLVAVEFDPKLGITVIREAEEDEFKGATAKAEAEKKRDGMRDDLITALEEIEFSTAAGLATYLGDKSKRPNISRLLKNDDAFTESGKQGREKLYKLSPTYNVSALPGVTLDEPIRLTAVQAQLLHSSDAQFVCYVCSEPAEAYIDEDKPVCNTHNVTK